ncbi:MAG: T9SS type A sorting domain-containing protein [Bacteroidia bacterium]|nr:T9SS type A sorting domain-containing protein [Bacteroidia bacterium]
MQFKNNILCAITLLLSNVLVAQVTKVGNDTLIDIASWNVEWFGDITYGPTNEVTQFNNVKSVITNTQVDVWGLCEISNPTTFYNLLTELPSYQGVLANYSQTQKTALVYNKDVFEMLSNGLIIDQTNNDYYNAFASGRYPFEVVLRTKTYPFDSVYFYVVHLKANSGSSDQASYTRRANASLYFQEFLNTQRIGKKIVVLGDWNDDVDQSVVRISGNYLTSPFQNFNNDSTRYIFPSMELSLAGETTYPGFTPANMIDHLLTSKALYDSFYVRKSAAVLKLLSAQISGYTSNTSDHYPILARFNLKRYIKPIPIDTLPKDTFPNDTIPSDTVPNTGINKTSNNLVFNIYPNPTNGEVSISCNAEIDHVIVYNILGEAVYQTQLSSNAQAINLPEHLQNGMYLFKIQTQYGFLIKRIQLLRN